MKIIWLTVVVTGLIFHSYAFADSAPAVGFHEVNGTEGLKVEVFYPSKSSDLSSQTDYSDILKARRYALDHTPDKTYYDHTVNLATGNTATVTFMGQGVSPYEKIAIIREFGFFEVKKGGTYHFNISSATEASAFFLGGDGQPGSGNLIIARNGSNTITHAPGLPNPLGLDFFAPDQVPQLGWYPIELILIVQNSAIQNERFDLSISGPEAVKFKNGYVHAATVTSFVPLHRYSFSHTDENRTVIDSGVADTVNGQLVGDAQISGGALVTDASKEAGARLDISAITRFFHGSFTIEDWIVRRAMGPDKQTLFSFAGDDKHYVLGRIVRTSSGWEINIGFNNGTAPAITLRAAAPEQGVKTLISVSYDGASQEMDLYINGKKVDSGTLATGVSMGDFVKQEYIGIAGLSPLGDPSFDGNTDEFRMYRVALNPAQIAQNFQIGPEHQIPQ